jgi:hypothetical protein
MAENAVALVRELLTDINEEKWLKLLQFLAGYSEEEHDLPFIEVFNLVAGHLDDIPKHLRTFQLRQDKLLFYSYEEISTSLVGILRDNDGLSYDEQLKILQGDHNLEASDAKRWAEQTRKLLYFANVLRLNSRLEITAEEIAPYINCCMIDTAGINFKDAGNIEESQKLEAFLVELAKQGKLNGLYELSPGKIDSFSDESLQIIFENITRLSLYGFTEKDVKRLPIKHDQIKSLQLVSMEEAVIELFPDPYKSTQLEIYEVIALFREGEGSVEVALENPFKWRSGMSSDNKEAYRSWTGCTIGVSRGKWVRTNITADDADMINTTDTLTRPPHLKSLQIDGWMEEEFIRMFIRHPQMIPTEAVFLNVPGAYFSDLLHRNIGGAGQQVLRWAQVIGLMLQQGATVFSMPQIIYDHLKWLFDFKPGVTVLINVPQFIYYS